MSMSVVVRDSNNREEALSVVGSSELESMWKPILARRDLPYLKYIASAGLSIDEDNYKDVVGEIRVLLHELEVMCTYENDIANPVFRCRRLLEILESHPPSTHARIYIG